MPPVPRRVFRLAMLALGLLLLCGAALGLRHGLRHVGPRDVLDALSATPPSSILHALGLLALSLCVMMIYDLPGILFARRLPDAPRLAARRIALASFCAYALSHVLGAPALSGAAIRLRLYAEWRVPPAGIARIVALSGTMFALGGVCLAALLLLLRPGDVPLLNSGSSDVLRLLGAGLLGTIGFYVLVAQRRPTLALFGRQIPLPGRRLAAAQVLISCADIGIAGGILFAVLPAAPGLSLAAILAIYLIALAGGLFSGVPAGLGVFDTVLLLGLSPYVPAASAISAILLFRVLYYLIPASAAGLCFAGHELLVTAKGEPN